MTKTLGIALTIGLWTSAGAADLESGKELFLFTQTAAGNCLDCHDEGYFSDSQQRLAESFLQVKGWVQGCNLHFDVGWFPEEEDDVAAYLNHRFYRYPAE